MKAKDCLSKARIDLIAKYPFFGVLALRLKLVEMDSSLIAWFHKRDCKPTLAVDGKTMWYHSPFVESLTRTRLIAATAHEVGHCMLSHMTRRAHRDPEKWLRATDYVVNGMLKRCGFDIDEENWLFNPKWDDSFTAEHIYNLLPDEPDSKNKQQPMDWIFDANAEKNPELADEWEMAVQQAAIAAHQAGKLPSHLERFIKELLEPQIDWRAVLRQFVTEKTKMDYSWTKPNKYYAASGLMLPSLYSEQMGTLAVVIDDSGSINDRILNVFGNETSSIVNSVRPLRTLLISCDARVNHVDDFDQFTPFSVDAIKVHGGGGTDFRPPFDWLAEQGIRPSALIYLTDGHGSFPKADPGYPVLWCMITKVQAPWGQTVRVKPD